MGLFNSGSFYNSIDVRNSTPQHIKGISCDVRNCTYHDGDHYCTAEKIYVGPSNAVKSADTICATFKAKTK